MERGYIMRENGCVRSVEMRSGLACGRKARGCREMSLRARNGSNWQPSKDIVVELGGRESPAPPGIALI